MIPGINEQIVWCFEEANLQMETQWGIIPLDVTKKTFRTDEGLIGVDVSSPGKPSFKVIYGNFSSSA